MGVAITGADNWRVRKLMSWSSALAFSSVCLISSSRSWTLLMYVYLYIYIIHAYYFVKKSGADI